VLRRALFQASVALYAASIFVVESRAVDRVVERPVAGADTVVKLRNIVFTRDAATSGISEAFVYKERGYGFKNLDEINEYNNRASRKVDATARDFTLDDTPLESPYWWKARTQSGAEEFVRLLAQAFPVEMKRANAVQVSRAYSILEKALAQRDLLQAYSLVSWAGERSSDAGVRVLALQLEQMIATALKPLLLTDADYNALVAQLPKVLATGFTSRQTYSLSQNYLPERVIAPDESWLEIPNTGRPFRHFLTFGGRSFVKVYVRAPEVSNGAMMSLWSRLYAAYGNQLHVHAGSESTPPGMETMLVRTFGVFLRNGEFRDSFWPEEVTLRVFKYARPQVDARTSDFRGSLFFRYVLSRSALVANPASLGLRRVFDDDTQYFGFLGDAPDRQHALSDVVTTMRSNCIGCHSGLFYGLNTIFSFERDPRPAAFASTRDAGVRGESADRPLPGEFKSILHRLNIKER